MLEDAFPRCVDKAGADPKTSVAPLGNFCRRHIGAIRASATI